MGDPERLAITATALRSALALGYGRRDIVEVIRIME
jgi:hypothetical protein